MDEIAKEAGLKYEMATLEFQINCLDRVVCMVEHWSHNPMVTCSNNTLAQLSLAAGTMKVDIFVRSYFFSIFKTTLVQKQIVFVIRHNIKRYNQNSNDIQQIESAKKKLCKDNISNMDKNHFYNIIHNPPKKVSVPVDMTRHICATTPISQLPCVAVQF